MPTWREFDYVGRDNDAKDLISGTHKRQILPRLTLHDFPIPCTFELHFELFSLLLKFTQQLFATIDDFPLVAVLQIWVQGRCCQGDNGQQN